MQPIQCIAKCLHGLMSQNGGTTGSSLTSLFPSLVVGRFPQEKVPETRIKAYGTTGPCRKTRSLLLKTKQKNWIAYSRGGFIPEGTSHKQCCVLFCLLSYCGRWRYKTLRSRFRRAVCVNKCKKKKKRIFKQWQERLKPSIQYLTLYFRARKHG